MANENHLKILKQGVEVWNEWRKNNPDEIPDLRKADLRRMDLTGADFREANLIEANLFKADLYRAKLRKAILSNAYLSEVDLAEADLSEADLKGAVLSDAEFYLADLKYADLKRTNLARSDFREANLRKADLRKAYLYESNLTEANLEGANLREANLQLSIMTETDFTDADLTNCSIYGISAWNLKLEKAIQKDLIITPSSSSVITVDNLEVAQFLYLLLNNEKIRSIIDTITSKVVLILGRFTHKRKAILDAIKEEFRDRNYLPVLFDFEGPASRDITETISTLAHIAKFVIADITDARSIPQELKTIIPNLPSVPVQPLLQSGKDEYGMFEHFKRYPWVIAIYRYSGLDDLMKNMGEKVIIPLEAKLEEVQKK